MAKGEWSDGVEYALGTTSPDAWLGPIGEWPPVLPVVLYNGDAPWTARVEMRDLIAPVAPSLEPF